jgi:anti-sigma B factor antagonist
MVETKTQQVGDITVVEISGRLLLGTSLGYAENTLHRLIDAGTRKLVIDLTRLEHMDSSGLGMLIYLSGRMDQSGGTARIAGATGSVARAFEVAHAERVLRFDQDVQAACSNLTARGASG